MSGLTLGRLESVIVIQQVPQYDVTAMPKDLKVGDHVRWNSEAGRVSGVIIKEAYVGHEVQGIHTSRDGQNRSCRDPQRGCASASLCEGKEVQQTRKGEKGITSKVRFGILMVVLILLLVSWVALRGIGAAGVQAFASWQDSARYALAVFNNMKHDLARMIPH
jgi:hypothetical protein